MESTKKSVTKPILLAAGSALVLTAAQLYVLGALGGIGPLKFLRSSKLAKLPGNAAKYHPEHVKPLESSPLSGKRLLFLGSSVTNGSAAMEVSMADYISRLDNCQVVKEAVNGTTLVDKDRFSYLARLKALNADQHFDAVICQLSTNDATQKLPLGTISMEEHTNFHTDTVVGSMEAIISYVKKTWNCPVVFYTGTKYDSTEYQAMVDALYALRDKWDIGIIDLWNDAEMNAVSKEDYAFFMHDPIHPTQAGYLLWWTPKFQNYLYSSIG